MNKTRIKYLYYTWNPLAMLCDPVSAGCKNCWHRRRAKMLSKNPSIPNSIQAAYAGESAPALITKRIEEPYKVKKPARIGVQFMGDLFHEKIDFFHGTDRVFAEMENCSWHTFIVLTKRPDRMLEYCNFCEYESTDGSGNLETASWEWPSNVWAGVSIEDQKTADERIPKLLKLRWSGAKVLFVSAEPMLESIYMEPYLPDIKYGSSLGIDWVIAGPETGPGARPCPKGAILDLAEQCFEADIPFFDKRSDYIVREFPE